MNNTIGENIRKYREFKGYSQGYMAHEMGLTQSAYGKIEKQETKLTLERLYRISEILETKLEELLGIQANKIYQQEFNDNSKNYQEIQNLHQENKEIYEKLLQSKDEQIELLKQLLERK